MCLAAAAATTSRRRPTRLTAPMSEMEGGEGGVRRGLRNGYNVSGFPIRYRSQSYLTRDLISEEMKVVVRSNCQGTTT